MCSWLWPHLQTWRPLRRLPRHILLTLSHLINSRHLIPSGFFQVHSRFALRWENWLLHGTWDNRLQDRPVLPFPSFASSRIIPDCECPLNRVTLDERVSTYASWSSWYIRGYPPPLYCALARVCMPISASARIRLPREWLSVVRCIYPRMYIVRIKHSSY